MGTMKNVFAKKLEVLDDQFFDKDLFTKWFNNLYDCTEITLQQFKDSIGNIEGFYYQLNPTVLEEVVYDAIIGLRKIVVSENNDVKEPNPFKIAAHLGYWFVRHKPIMFCQWTTGFNFEEIKFKDKIENNAELKLATIWEIKHINEIVAVAFMIRYIFKIDNEESIICDDRELKKFKGTGNFYFQDFNELGNAVFDKLKYHLSYRSITPETIEHFLEGYTLHPIWKLTANLWEAEEDET